MERSDLIGVIKSFGYFPIQIRESNISKDGERILTSIFKSRDDREFALIVTVTENERLQYPFKIEVQKINRANSESNPRIICDMIHTKEMLSESLENAANIVLSKGKPANLEPEKFIKSKYLTYVYEKETGYVHPCFQSGEDSNGFVHVDLIDFLKKFNVKVDNFSKIGLVDFVKINNMMDIITMNEPSKKYLIVACNVFCPTESKGQAIKQMAEAERNLDDLVNAAILYTERADLITADFVAQMNGEYQGKTDSNLIPPNLLKGVGGIGHPAGVATIEIEKDESLDFMDDINNL